MTVTVRAGPPIKALRTLANRWVGILHGCLGHRACYDELTAWPPHLNGTPLDTHPP